MNAVSQVKVDTVAKAPRLSANQRRELQRAQEQAEQAQAWELFKAEYPVRFTNAMYQYSALSHENFQVNQLDAETYEFTRNYTKEVLKVTPPVNFDWEYKYSLETVEREVVKLEEERAEAERRRLLRTNALSKLTAEERQALGL